MAESKIDTLLLDIGGVLLSNGWDRRSRRRAAERFGFDYDEMDERHHLTFDTYEEGKLSLDQYLDRVVFHQERSFGREEFKRFMFAQSEPKQDMLELVRRLKQRHGLHLVAVSNEGRELTEHRIATFRLHEIIDFSSAPASCTIASRIRTSIAWPWTGCRARRRNRFISTTG